MSDLFDAARDRSSACTTAAGFLVPSILGDAKITRAMLTEAMTSAYGGSETNGRWSERESFELLEHALALAMRNRTTMRQQFAARDVLQAIHLLGRLPTQLSRASSSSSRRHLTWLPWLSCWRPPRPTSSFSSPAPTADSLSRSLAV